MFIHIYIYIYIYVTVMFDADVADCIKQMFHGT